MYNSGTLFDGRYLLKERKGRGSFGEVWLATDQQAGVDFALKIYVAMNTKGLEEFRKEYQLACGLICSNLLHANYMGICQEDSCPYLVMPFCPRGSSSFVGNIDEPTLWKFLHDVANGLSYLHNQNPPIVHQDIKPDNILQTKNGDFVITDFGISKQMRATLHSTANNTSGAIAYMGPERFGRQYQTIKSSDIWSLGATLYELATGQLPFEGRGGGMMNAGAEAPDLPACFSAELNDVVRSCMSKEPWDRPSASQLVDISDKAIKGSRKVEQPFHTAVPETHEKTPVAVRHEQKIETTVQQEPQVEAAQSTKSKNNVIIGICAIVSVLLLGFIAYMIFGSDSNDVPPVTSTVQPSVQSEPAKPDAVPPTEPQSIVSTENTVQSGVDNTVSSPSTPSAVKTEKKEKSANTVSSGTLNLGYAVWEGQIKNGKPSGKGKMTFNKDYDLQGHSIKSGDVVEGTCSNGQLEGFCTWTGKEGKKTIMLGS